MTVIVNTPPNLEQLATRAFAKFWEGTKDEKNARSILNKIIKTFGPSMKILYLTTAAIEDGTTHWRSEGASEKTCNRRLSKLNKMLKWAERRGYLPVAPFIEKFTEGPGRLRYVSDDEQAQMISGLLEAGYGRFADLVAFLADTGMRLGEALDLTWDNCSEDGWVRLDDTKNGRPRRVPLTQRVQLMLTAGVEAAAHEGLYADTVFHDVGRTSFRKAWNKVKADMGLEADKGFTPHALRHAFASTLLNRGADIFTVSRLLGHSSIKTTADTYGHESPERARIVVSLLEPEVSSSGH